MKYAELSGYGSDDLELLVIEILEWADDEGAKRGFDDGFIASLQDQLDGGNDLTPNQLEALCNIINERNIPV